MDLWRIARWAMYGLLTVGAFLYVQLASEGEARADDNPVAVVSQPGVVVQAAGGVVEVADGVVDTVTQPLVKATAPKAEPKPRLERQAKPRPGHRDQALKAKPKRDKHADRDRGRSAAGTERRHTSPAAKPPRIRDAIGAVDEVIRRLPAINPAGRASKSPCGPLDQVGEVVDGATQPVVKHPVVRKVIDTVDETTEPVVDQVPQVVGDTADLIGQVVDGVADTVVRVAPPWIVPQPPAVDPIAALPTVPILGPVVPSELLPEITPASFWDEPEPAAAAVVPLCAAAGVDDAPGADAADSRKKKVRRPALADGKRCPTPAAPGDPTPDGPALNAAGAGSSASSSAAGADMAAALGSGEPPHSRRAFRVVWPADVTATGRNIRPGTSPA